MGKSQDDHNGSNAYLPVKFSLTVSSSPLKLPPSNRPKTTPGDGERGDNTHV